MSGPGSRRAGAAMLVCLLAAGCQPTPSPPVGLASQTTGPTPTNPPLLAQPSPAPSSPSSSLDVGPSPSPTSAPTTGPSPSPPRAPTLGQASRSTAIPGAVEPAAYEGARFPPGFDGYHTYAQLSAEVAAVATAHPDLVDLFSIGRSAEGAQLWAARVGEDVHVDHGRPEALFDGLHHGLEHLSLEMTLAILHWLVDGYGSDAEVTAILRSRVVDIVFAVNPDGAEYDISGGRFHGWRKNRQPIPGSSTIGTDLNRNYDDHWGCCGLVSANASSPYYRGPDAFSAPETRALAAFVESRVIDGRQRIRVAVTFHTSGRLILWPYGYSRAAIPADMSADDHAVFVALGEGMAARNGYRAEQASGLYVDSGTARDWEYGVQHVFAFTIELGTGLYQPTSAIAPETGRNRAAILYLIGMADCPYRAIGKQAAYCRPAVPDPVAPADVGYSLGLGGAVPGERRQVAI